MERIRVVEILGNGEGGGTQIAMRVACGLSAAKYDITVITPAAQWIADVCSEHNLRYAPLPLLESRASKKTTATLAALLAEAQPDIISAHGTRAAWYALRALRGAQAHYGHPALNYCEHLLSFDARSGPRRWPWLAIERYICQHADALATTCAANAQWAESHGWTSPDRIAMTHYGIDLDVIRAAAAHPIPRSTLGLPEHAPLIGTVGRLIPQKGFVYLLEAAARILPEHPDAQVVVVGDGELRGALEARALELGIARQVRFLGARAEPWRILAHCDVIAFPSLHEGLPLTALEALTIGKAVVATRLNGTAEIIQPGHNGLLVPPRDTESLARALALLLRDPARRAHLAANGPVSVAAYDASAMVERFDAMYQALYARRARETVTAVVSGHGQRDRT